MLRRLRKKRPRAPALQIRKRRIEISAPADISRIRRHENRPVLRVDHQRLHGNQRRRVVRIPIVQSREYRTHGQRRKKHPKSLQNRHL